MGTNPPKRFLSIRLTEEELKEVYRHCERSACSSLTEYVRKVLTMKPVIVRMRNESQDELLEVMVGIKRRLDRLVGERADAMLLEEMREVKALIHQVSLKWTR